MDSRDFVSFGLDNHDIGDIIKKQVDSLLKQKIIKNQSEAQILTIGAIDNESGESIDTEIIASELTRYLSNSEKFVVVNAGRDKKIEQILRDSRKMRENAEYNQYTTIEQGNLIAPSYALTGKITKRNRKILDDEINEYVFSFTLTDLKLGAVRWVGNEQIAKKLPKREVKNFSVAESRNVETNKAESGVDSSAKNKNHFIFGADFGAVSLGAIEITPIIADLGAQSYRIKPNVKSIFATLGDGDSKEKINPLWALPLTVRIGYLRDIGNFGVAVNALYIYMYAKIDNKSWEIRANGGNVANANAINIDGKANVQRAGGEIVLYYTPLASTRGVSAFVGASALKDFASKLTISIHSNDSTDEAQITRKINALYVGAKVGLVWHFSEYANFSYEMNYSFVASGGNALSSGFGVIVLGIGVRI